MKVERRCETVTETWRPVVDLPGYEVSSCGRVRHGNHQMRCYTHNRGYLVMATTIGKGPDRRTIKRYVHRLVLEAFVGKSRPGEEARHLNSDCRDNRLANLCWGTPAENSADMVKAGRQSMGESRPCAKLNDEAVRSIRLRWHPRASRKALAAEYGVSGSTIYNVTSGRRWCHVQ